MNKGIQNIFILVSVIYFMIAGTGYNVSATCCKKCSKPTKSTQLSKVCKKNVESYGANRTTCNVFKKKLKSCFFVRVQLDVPVNVNQKQLVSFAPKILQLFNHQFLLKTGIHQVRISEVYPPPENRFSMSGRKILSLKAVLLI